MSQRDIANMARYKVAVVNLGYESYHIEREILEPVGAELILVPKDCLTEEDVIDVAKDADAILVREAPIKGKVLESIDRCRVIVRYGVGVDNIDLEAAKRKKIYVANIPGYGTEEVSDHAVALLLACIRNLLVRDKNLRQGKFETDINDKIYRTTGKNLGLIGYGQISKALHRKWKGFLPNRVLVYDPYISQETIQENGAEKADFHILLTEADYISIHTPLTPETKYIIDEAALRKMKPTAILINTSRGEVIEENALVKALNEGWILAAGLDVFEKEPLDRDHPLIGIPNVVLTGHVGWFSKDSVRELQTRAAQEVLRVFSGESPICWVNKW
jgi:D-3-phosphoglycerate dehydrogenase